MSRAKKLLHLSKLTRGKSGLCLSPHIFVSVMVAAHRVGKPEPGRPRSSDSRRKVLAFKKIAFFIFQTIRHTFTFPLRLPDPCRVLDLGRWLWAFFCNNHLLIWTPQPSTHFWSENLSWRKRTWIAQKAEQWVTCTVQSESSWVNPQCADPSQVRSGFILILSICR